MADTHTKESHGERVQFTSPPLCGTRSPIFPNRKAALLVAANFNPPTNHRRRRFENRLQQY